MHLTHRNIIPLRFWYLLSIDDFPVRKSHPVYVEKNRARAVTEIKHLYSATNWLFRIVLCSVPTQPQWILSSVIKNTFPRLFQYDYSACKHRKKILFYASGIKRSLVRHYNNSSITPCWSWKFQAYFPCYWKIIHKYR